MKRALVAIAFLLAACQPIQTTLTSPPPPVIGPRPPVETDTPQLTSNPVTPTVAPTIPASTIELEGAEVPPGFSLIKFADLYRPTAFTFDDRGRMYATSQDGNVYILQDEN